MRVTVDSLQYCLPRNQRCLPFWQSYIVWKMKSIPLVCIFFLFRLLYFSLELTIESEFFQSWRSEKFFEGELIKIG